MPPHISLSTISVVVVAIIFIIDKHEIMDPHSRAAKKHTSHGNEVLPQDITHLIQNPCYQPENLCQDPAGNQTTRRPTDHCKDMETAVVWSCLPFIRFGQNHLVRHSERGKKTEEEVGRYHQTINSQAWSSPSTKGSGEQGKMEEIGCEIICGPPTILAIKG